MSFAGIMDLQVALSPSSWHSGSDRLGTDSKINNDYIAWWFSCDSTPLPIFSLKRVSTYHSARLPEMKCRATSDSAYGKIPGSEAFIHWDGRAPCRKGRDKIPMEGHGISSNVRDA